MKPSTLPMSVLTVCLLSFGLAVVIGRSTRPEPVAAPMTPQAINMEPESVLIHTGSVEHRLRAMEAQLLELRNRVELLETAKN